MKFDKLPDQLPATVAELDEYADAITKEINVFQARHDAGQEFSPEDVARFEELADAHDKVTEARDAVAAADQSQTDKLNSVLARTAKKPVDAEPAAEAEAEAADSDTDGDGTDEAAADVVAEAEAATVEAAEQSQAVAASAGKAVSFAGATNGNNDLPGPAATGEKPKGWELLPSAPKYGEFGNDKVGFAEIAQSIASVNPGQNTGRQRTGQVSMEGQDFATQAVARLPRPQPEGPVPANEHEAYEAIQQMGREIPGKGKVSAQALVAAGGWCAPSEQIYTFCNVPPASDLISLPDFPFDFSRGGVRVPVNPDMSALLDDVWHFTETELEAVDGNGDPTAVKPIIELPCPDQFIEWRLEAIGWAAKAGILQRQAWPEAIENALEQIQVAHQHRVSQKTIAKMVAGSGTAKVVPADSVLGATSSVLNGLALQAANLRYNKGLKGDATIEGVAPVWFREVLRADLALREGKDTLAVTNAEIDNWLAVRDIYLQYVVDWQTRGSGQPGNMATLVYPATVQVMLFPAGTWFRTLNNIITLGVQYPLQQLVLNQYTHIFTEDSFQVGKRCDQSILVTLPICISGAIGARQTVACNTPAETP
ncbi:major capsid protein [Mycobacterium sp. DL440]|uniref:major capsid protein n=1 Tax=Mycobacterium sp. DL440 TaxID=2675523 RepID=UPI00141EC13F|nr:major capsid protein [Mycobacterium sp. DL440]